MKSIINIHMNHDFQKETEAMELLESVLVSAGIPTVGAGGILSVDEHADAIHKVDSTSVHISGRMRVREETPEDALVRLYRALEGHQEERKMHLNAVKDHESTIKVLKRTITQMTRLKAQLHKAEQRTWRLGQDKY